MAEQISEEEYGRRRRELRLELGRLRGLRDAARDAHVIEDIVHWEAEMHKVIERQKELDAIAPDWPGPEWPAPEIQEEEDDPLATYTGVDGVDHSVTDLSAPSVTPEAVVVNAIPASKFGTPYVESEIMLAAMAGEEDTLMSLIRSLSGREARNVAGAAQVVTIAASMRMMEDS